MAIQCTDRQAMINDLSQRLGSWKLMLVRPPAYVRHKWLRDALNFQVTDCRIEEWKDALPPQSEGPDPFRCLELISRLPLQLILRKRSDSWTIGPHIEKDTTDLQLGQKSPNSGSGTSQGIPKTFPYSYFRTVPQEKQHTGCVQSLIDFCSSPRVARHKKALRKGCAEREVVIAVKNRSPKSRDWPKGGNHNLFSARSRIAWLSSPEASGRQQCCVKKPRARHSRKPADRYLRAHEGCTVERESVTAYMPPKSPD